MADQLASLSLDQLTSITGGDGTNFDPMPGVDDYALGLESRLCASLGMSGMAKDNPLEISNQQLKKLCKDRLDAIATTVEWRRLGLPNTHTPT